MSKESYMELAIAWAEMKPTSSIKAVCDGYESPKAYTNVATNESIQPDISFTTSRGAKHFSEIALKDESPQKLVTRWKLLSSLASMKNGSLHLLTPKGHKTFTQKLIEQYKIDAIVHSI